MKSAIRNPQSKISSLPIGIFDSGVGGLTVYRALHERLPNEHFVYLGDTARVPYGTKSLATVERYGIENARFLEAHGIKLLVVACNTASALALPAIRGAVTVPVIGVIEPGARAAVSVSGGKTIGVIATEATVKSGAYAGAIARIDSSIGAMERACPLFVPLAEEGWADTDVARAVAAQYLVDFKTEELGALVLGCTHYPILRDLIRDVVGSEVPLIDSGEAAARVVEELLDSDKLNASASEAEQSGAMSEVEAAKGAARQLCDDLDHFYVTDAAERFAKVAERFLGMSPSVLEAVEVWGHDELRTY
ncbi:MAG TPA: glutamate racemase [Pyrinomonadaceae bacterium]|nr:glutamate racemase [Pyrinomonadaceae bacterium]